MNTLTKEEWIAEVSRLLCASQGAESDQERANCLEWAGSIYDYHLEAAENHEEIGTPQEAHDYELSCG